MVKKPAKKLEYKIESNIPYIRVGPRPWDDNLPEYITMLKMKIGDSFEFPKDRVRFVHNARIHLRKIGSPLSFTHTSRNTFVQNKKLEKGRCWRIKDKTYKPRGPQKIRRKGAEIDLTEHES